MEWNGFYYKHYIKINQQFVFINQPYDVKQQSNGENLSNTQSLVRNIFITINTIYKLEKNSHGFSSTHLCEDLLAFQ